MSKDGSPRLHRCTGKCNVIHLFYLNLLTLPLRLFGTCVCTVDHNNNAHHRFIQRRSFGVDLQALVPVIHEPTWAGVVGGGRERGGGAGEPLETHAGSCKELAERRHFYSCLNFGMKKTKLPWSSFKSGCAPPVAAVVCAGPTNVAGVD